MIGCGDIVLFYSKIYYNLISSNVITLLDTIAINQGPITALSLSASGNVLIICCRFMITIVTLSYYVSNPENIPLITYGSHIIDTTFNIDGGSNTEPNIDQAWYGISSCHISTDENEFIIGSASFGNGKIRSFTNNNGVWSIAYTVNGNYNPYSSDYLSSPIGLFINYTHYKMIVLSTGKGIDIYNNNTHIEKLLKGIEVTSLFLTQNSNYLACIYKLPSYSFKGFTVFSFRYPFFVQIGGFNVESSTNIMSSIVISEDGNKVFVFQSPLFLTLKSIGVYYAVHNGADVSYVLTNYLYFPTNTSFINFSSSINNLFVISANTNLVSIYDILNSGGTGTGTNIGLETETIIYSPYLGNPLPITLPSEDNKIFISSTFDSGIFVIGYINIIYICSNTRSTLYENNTIKILNTIHSNEIITALTISSVGSLIVACCSNIIKIIRFQTYSVFSIDLLDIFPNSISSQFENIQVYVDNSQEFILIGLPMFDSKGRTCIFTYNYTNSITTLLTILTEYNGVGQGVSIASNKSYNIIIGTYITTVFIGTGKGINIYNSDTNYSELQQTAFEDYSINDMYATNNGVYIICSLNFEPYGGFGVLKSKFSGIRYNYFLYDNVNIGSSSLLNITSKVYINEDGRTVVALDQTYNSNTGAIGVFTAKYLTLGDTPSWNLVQILPFSINSNIGYGSDLYISKYNLLAVSKSGDLFIYNTQKITGIINESGSGTGTVFGSGTGIGSLIVYNTYVNNPIELNIVANSGVFIASSFENGIFAVGCNSTVFIYKITYNLDNKIENLTLLKTIPINGDVSGLNISYGGNLLVVCSGANIVVINLILNIIDFNINLLNVFNSSTISQFINIRVSVDSSEIAFAIGLPNFDYYGRTCIFKFINGIWILTNTVYEFNSGKQGRCISLNLSNDLLIVGHDSGFSVYINIDDQLILSPLSGSTNPVLDLYLTNNAKYLVAHVGGIFRHFSIFQRRDYGAFFANGANTTDMLTDYSKIHINETGTVVSILNPEYNSNSGAIGIFMSLDEQKTDLYWGLIQLLPFPSYNKGTIYGSASVLSHYNVLAVRASGHIFAYDLQNTVSEIGTQIYTYDNNNLGLNIGLGTGNVFISSSFAGDVFVVGYDNTVLFYSMIYQFSTSKNVITLLSAIPINQGIITSLHLSISGKLLIVCCSNIISIVNLTYIVSDPFSLQTQGHYTKIININLLDVLNVVLSQLINAHVFIDNSETLFAIGLPNFNINGKTCIFELINSNWILKNDISSSNNLSQGNAISINLENKFLIVGSDTGINIYKYTTNGFILNQQLLSGLKIYNLYLTLNANFLVCNTDYYDNGKFLVFELNTDDTFQYYNETANIVNYSSNLVLKSAIQINEKGDIITALDPTYNSNAGAIGIFIPPMTNSGLGWQLVQILAFSYTLSSSSGANSTLNYYNLLAISRKSNSIIIFNSKNINGIGTTSGNGGTGTDTSTENKQYINTSSLDYKIGFSVSINYGATIAVIGMPGYNSNTGGIIIMKNTVPINEDFNPANTKWSFVAFLSDTSDDAKGSQQGYSISPLSISNNLSGTVIAVGAPYYRGVGGTYIYVRNNSGVWTQQGHVLTIDIPNSMFGCSVSIDMSGNNLAVGAYGVDNNSGATYIYVRLNSVWTLTQRISDILQDGIMQGFSVSMGFYNNVLLVGAPGYTRTNSGTDGVANTGAVFLYYNDSGVWVKKYVFKDSLPIANGSQQGYSVSLSSFGAYKVGEGESIMIAIGAPNYNNGRGAIYAYQLLSSDVDNWHRLYPLITDSSDFALGANLGSSVSLVLGNEGFIMASGANNYNTNQGALYFYKGIYNDITNISTASLYLKAYSDNPVFGTTGNSHFGNSVAVNNLGNYMLVGAPELNNIGSVKAYYNDGEKWYEDTRFKTILDGVLGLTGMSGLNPYNSQILTGNSSSTSFEPNGQIFVDIDLSSMTETGDTLFVNVQSKKTRTTIPLELYYISDD